jgi:hypothetical protein
MSNLEAEGHFTIWARIDVHTINGPASQRSLMALEHQLCDDWIGGQAGELRIDNIMVEWRPEHCRALDDPG